MPSGDEHKQGAKRLAVVLGVVLPAVVWWQTQSIKLATLGFIPALTYRLVLAPDLDTEQSQARQFVRKSVKYGTPLAAGIAVVTNLGAVTGMIASAVGGLTATTAIPVALVGAGVIGYFGGETVDKTLTWMLPPHRELFHDASFWLVVTLIGVGVAWTVLGSSGQIIRLAAVVFVACIGLWSLYHLWQDDELL